MKNYADMAPIPFEQLIRIRQFPPVVHPCHARELLEVHDAETLAAWTAGYAITVPEHRRLIEDLLVSLSLDNTGKAVLINGIYGAGKSHLLVLLHLLTALPDAWAPFLQSHTTFHRYAKSIQEHRRLVVHFSLDEYSPQSRLEEAVGEEVAHALERAGIQEMAGWYLRDPRPEAWGDLLACLRTHGYDGLLLLVDELSLFLAGKSPSRREGDAAFLQFLAGWSARSPFWLIGALQRNLSDVGALRTHSWRQVEDRFQRYTLSPQEIGRILCEKLVQRMDPSGIRQMIAAEIVPAATAHGIGIAAAELQADWPFHPQSIDLLMAVANGYLSPHRSAVEILQQLSHSSWLQQRADRLITPLDLFSLVRADLQRDERLERVWHVINLLEIWSDTALDARLAHQVLDLLCLLHFAGRAISVAQLREWLFDGQSSPAPEEVSNACHHLRRYGAYLAVTRDADPGAEVFRLEIDDEIGALATMYMQEMRREFAHLDARVSEMALTTCAGANWPLASALAEPVRLNVLWCAAERRVLLASLPAISRDAVIRLYEGVLAHQADAQVVLLWPGESATVEHWHAATALLDGPAAGTLILWIPRVPLQQEFELWAEFAAWQRAALDTAISGVPREKSARGRCLARAEELRAAVEASVQRVYREGHWVNGRGAEGSPPEAPALAECLAAMLEPGFSDLFPLFPTLTAGDLPTRAATQQLLTHFILPGEIQLPPQALLGEYIERFALPLGCATFDGMHARVMPPRWEILQPLMELVSERPVTTADALASLQYPPLGLTPEQAQLALFAAVRSGALLGLDGFLQSLEVDLLSSNAVSFVAAPIVLDLRYRSLIHALAANWEVPVEVWPLACSQVEQRLRDWLKEWLPRLSAMREALADWSESLQVMPWAWSGCMRQLDLLAQLGERQQDSFECLLRLLEEEGEGQLPAIAPIWMAGQWWRAHRARVALFTMLPFGIDWQQASRQVCEQLAQGEASFAALAEIDTLMSRIWNGYREDYRHWHEGTYGAEVVAGLRLVFACAEFRAVKMLSRLPLPFPPPVVHCLDALAQAKARYCHGAFAQFDSEGVCSQCRLPCGNPSPLPDAVQVNRYAVEGLSAYAQLLREHPWGEDTRRRAARAPREMATRVDAILNWRLDDGAAALLNLLDERVLNWLTRESSPAGKRHLRLLQESLAGHDLTLAEARTALLAWLNPEDTLQDECVIAFE